MRWIYGLWAVLGVIASVSLVVLLVSGHDGSDGQLASTDPMQDRPTLSLPSDEIDGSCLGAPAYPEIRPENATANATPGEPIPPGQYQQWNPGFDAYLALIDGWGCQGTTEQILDWAATKWGFADQPSILGGSALHIPDLAKAMAVQESDWRQSVEGDFHGGECDWVGGPDCPYPYGNQSFGIISVKRTSWPGSYPSSTLSTAFSADYAMAAVRHHYDGASWLPSLKDDIWGAVEAWYSGKDDSSGDWYRAAVYDSYQTKPWQQPGYDPRTL